MDNNLYQYTEKIGRKKVIDCIKNNSLPITNITPTEGQFDKWDLEGFVKDKAIIIECKNRKCSSTRYKDIMIDDNKFMANIEEAIKNNKISLLAVTYSDNICRLWDLRKLYREKKYSKGWSYNPVSSVEDKGYKYEKVVYFDNKNCFKEYAIYKEVA